MFVRAPASSANLGAGFDVLGMALDLHADCGVGSAPADAHQLEAGHPGRRAFEDLGGRGDIWMRTNIPMARGLGFSGAVRIAAAALAVVQADGEHAITDRATDILAVAARLENHGDNVAASLCGGVTAYVAGRAVPVPVGSTLGDAAFVAWIPDVTTSTDASRKSLDATVARADAVFNIGRTAQFVAAFAHDDPSLLVGSTEDRLHQDLRLPFVPGATDAIDRGVAAGAWCGWLSGSGPTVGLLCSREHAPHVAGALPGGAHSKILSIDRVGARLVSGAGTDRVQSSTCPSID